MPRKRFPKTGDTIDGRFKLTRLCSNDGGMGSIFFARDSDGEFDEPLILKYCKSEKASFLKRFKRETRLLNKLRSNSKVATVLALNAGHDPPYYVMKFYSDGDLSKQRAAIQADESMQEAIFLQMCDCITELHSRGIYHRDIKPQNFLVDGDDLVVSDLGLSMEEGSQSAFTSTSTSYRTEGFEPPEFDEGGFKHADAASDIYQLGKSFYVLLTDRKAKNLRPTGVHQAIYAVIERCCETEKNERYQSIDDLKRSIIAAYDVILNRVDGLARCRQLWDA